MKIRLLLILVQALSLVAGCGSKAEPEGAAGESHETLSARSKAHTVAETATKTGTQTSTGTATGTHVTTVTVTNTATAITSATDYYTITGTLTGTVKMTVSYFSWAGTSTNTTTNTRTTTAVGPLQGTGVVTKTVTATVTNSRNGTETKTASAATTGFVTFTGTTTVTVTNTVTKTNGARQGSGTRTVTATGTSAKTGTAVWTSRQTSTATQTKTVTDTRVVTNTGTGILTMTLTTTATDTATGACLGLWRGTTCGEWCLRETQTDRKVCRQYLDCYLSHNCGPSTCGGQDQVCGVNTVSPPSGTAPKIIADQVYQCMGCSGSTPAASCAGLPDTTPCTDGNACTLNDRCLGGACALKTPVVCAALDQCHGVGTCNAATGVCSNPVRADGSPCNDGNACTQTDSCVGGSCLGGNLVTCSPLDVCHQAGACDPSTGQCSNPALSCDDQNPCTTDGCDPKACKPDHCETTDICGHVLTYGPSCPEPPPPPSDIAITNATITAAGAIIRPGQTVSLTYTLQTSAAYSDFSAEFILFPANLPGGGIPVKGVALGGARQATVPAGTSQYSVLLPVPADLPPGTYNLYAHRYPDGTFWQGTDVYTVQAQPVLPSFELASYRAGSVQMFIDQASTVDPTDPTLYRPFDHSGTLGILSRSQDATQVPVRAYLYWPDQLTPPLPLQIWDFASQAYVSTLLVDNLKADQAQSLMLDLALPEATAQQLRAAIAPQTPVDTQILLTLNESAGLPEAPCPSSSPDSCRHQMQVPVTLFLPPAEADADAGTSTMRAFDLRSVALPSPAKKYKYDWVKDAGNEYFSTGIHFHADVQAGTDGLSATLQANVPVQVLWETLDVFRAEFSVSAPLEGLPSASGSLKFKCVSDFCAETPFSLSDLGTYHFSETYPIVQVTTVFVIVIVPVTASLGVDATVDFGTNIDASTGPNLASLSFTPSLSASISGWASAGVGVPGFSAGVEGRLKLIGATLAAPITAQCSVFRSGNWDVVTGDLREQMTVSGEMLSGNLSLYAEYPMLDWCSAWGIPYPCGLSIHHTPYNLCSWPGSKLGPWTVYDTGQRAFSLNAVCHPNTCAGDACGAIDDGCGGTIDCGGCDGEHACVNNTCQCSATCESLGWACGNGTTACTAGLSCPACPAGQYCTDHACMACSGSTPPDYGTPCGHCGGTVQCDGSCSIQDPPGYGSTCNVKNTNLGACANGGTVVCSGACQPANADIGDPSKWQPSTAPNGSWDWDCDGNTEQEYALPFEDCDCWSADWCPHDGRGWIGAIPGCGASGTWKSVPIVPPGNGHGPQCGSPVTGPKVMRCQ
jgi:hypothetical protein